MMSNGADGARRLESWLSALRARLRGLPDAEVAEILDELRGHVRESAGGNDLIDKEVAAALERLGSPEELGSLYVTDSLMTRAGRSWSPWLILQSLFRWATVSVTGIFAFLGLLAGYVVAMSFLFAALSKPFSPGLVGLWRLPGGELSLRLGLSSLPPPPGEELLGWWVVPIGLLAGASAIWMAMRFGRWIIHRYRPTRFVPT